MEASSPIFSAPTAMVEFEIGPEGATEPFTVHKEFACAYSHVLDAAFNSSFIEGATQKYRLDVSPTVFRDLVYWLYRQEVIQPYGAEYLEIKNKWKSVNQGPLKEDAAEELIELVEKQLLRLFQLWVLADRLLMASLQNHVAIILEELLGGYGDPERPITSGWVAYVYENTRPGSPLRDLTIDHFAYVSPARALTERPEDFPHEMLIDLASHMSSGIARKERYHARRQSEDEEIIRCYKYTKLWKSYFVHELQQGLVLPENEWRERIVQDTSKPEHLC